MATHDNFKKLMVFIVVRQPTKSVREKVKCNDFRKKNKITGSAVAKSMEKPKF